MRRFYIRNRLLVIMEADQSHDLESGSWRSRTGKGVVPVWNPAGSRPKKSWVSVWVWRKEKISFRPRQSGSRGSLLLSPFVEFQSSIDWMRPTHMSEGRLLPSVSWFTCLFQPETPTQTLRKMFDQMSGDSDPVKVTQKLTITYGYIKGLEKLPLIDSYHTTKRTDCKWFDKL